MSVLSESQHDEIAELLPDFAIGALDDGDLWRVEAHLDSCARCQAELDQLLDLIGVLSPVALPDASIKQLLFARAGLPLSAPTILPPAQEPRSVQSPAPMRPSPARPLVYMQHAHPARIALVAAVVAFLVLGGLVLGAWSVLQQQKLDDQREIVALLTDPEAAHRLTDSEVATGASATFYADPDHDQALLVARDLPPLNNGERYEIWLFAESGTRVAGGLFTPNSNGSALTIVDPAEPISTYWAVGVSVEPGDGSAAPTSPLILGGWIQ